MLRLTDAFNQLVLGHSERGACSAARCIGTVYPVPPTRRLLSGRLSGIGIAYPASRGDTGWSAGGCPTSIAAASALYELLRKGRFVMATTEGLDVECPTSCMPCTTIPSCQPQYWFARTVTSPGPTISHRPHRMPRPPSVTGVGRSSLRSSLG